MRVGIGLDVHAFIENRELILGGVSIPHSLGLAGHSDADVAIHAVIDAMLGALALGDLGTHFPDTDPSYLGVSSVELLIKAHMLIKSEAYDVGNIDLTIICEEPKIAPYREMMTANIAETLNIPKDCVSIKATTTEGLGFTGRKQGIAAQAVVLLEPSG